MAKIIKVERFCTNQTLIPSMSVNDASRSEIGVKNLFSVVDWQENPDIWVVGLQGCHEVLEGRSHSAIKSKLPVKY